MGTGSSGKGTSGKRGSNAKKPPEWTTRSELTAQDGSKIDLSENPLKYGEKANLNAKEREAVERFENKRFKNKIEYGALVDADGNIILEQKGNRGHVSMPARLYDFASVMSHNHPRSGDSVGSLGGTFSNTDIDTFATTGVRTMRATALEGTYSIQKGADFDARGIMRYYSESRAKNAEVYSKRMDALNADINSVAQRYNRGQVTRDEYNDAYDKYRAKANRAFNTFVVQQHNALIDGQKQYGYVYTLEGRE